MEVDESAQDFRKAKETVYRLLKIRVRSEKEIVDRLKRKSIPSEIITRTVDYFKSSGLIDDQNFARIFVTSRLNRPFGVSRIRFELRQKGVHDEIIQAALSKATEHFDEYESVLELAKKRKRKYERLEKLTVQRRLFSYLQRRGFNSSTITKAVKEVCK